jgi:hypothetical protein
MSKNTVDNSNRSGLNASENLLLIYSLLIFPTSPRKLHKRTPTSALSAHTVRGSVTISRHGGRNLKPVSAEDPSMLGRLSGPIAPTYKRHHGRVGRLGASILRVCRRVASFATTNPVARSTFGRIGCTRS